MDYKAPDRRHVRQHPRRPRHRRQDRRRLAHRLRQRRGHLREHRGRQARQAPQHPEPSTRARSAWRKRWRPSRLDVPDIILEMEEAQVGRYDRQRVLDLLRDLEFRTLVPRLPSVDDAIGPTAIAPPPPRRPTARHHRSGPRGARARLREAERFAYDLEARRQPSPYHSPPRRHRRRRQPAEPLHPGRAPYGARTARRSSTSTTSSESSRRFGDAESRRSPHNGNSTSPTSKTAASSAPASPSTRCSPPTCSAMAPWPTAATLGHRLDSASNGSSSRRLKLRNARAHRPHRQRRHEPAARCRPSRWRRLRLRLREVDCTLRLLDTPRGRAARSSISGSSSPTSRCPWCACSPAWKLHGIAIDTRRPRANVGRPQRADRSTSSPKLTTTSATSSTSARRRSSRRSSSTDRPAQDPQDQAGLLHRRADHRGLRGVHPIIDLILRWREHLPSSARPTSTRSPAPSTREDQRIHTTFDQAVGRHRAPPSNDPNLQNIPVRSGSAAGPPRLRARDIGADPILLCADYSQIELRIWRTCPRTPRLIQAFREDEDIHRRDRAPGLRRRRRRGDARAAQPRQGLQLRRALRPQRLRPRTSARASAAKKRAPSSSATSRSTTSVTALARRHRRRSAAQMATPRRSPAAAATSPTSTAPTSTSASAAERIAINMPMQGTASDIIKIAMNRLDEELAKEARPACSFRSTTSSSSRAPVRS